MKKLLVLAAALTALLVSCATTHRPVFDQGIPPENGATVHFGDGIHVLTVNGIDVNEAWYGKTFWSNESVRVVLPAGKTDIVFDLYYVESGQNYTNTFSAKGKELSLNLAAGKEYTMAFIWVKESGWWIFAKGHRGIGIYDKLPGVFGGLSDKNRILFFAMEFQ
jgi:hypothetical protein